MASTSHMHKTSTAYGHAAQSPRSSSTMTSGDARIVLFSQHRSCFYRSIPMGTIENGREIKMKFEEKEKSFDPEEVYKGQPNPTKI